MSVQLIAAAGGHLDYNGVIGGLRIMQYLSPIIALFGVYCLCSVEGVVWSSRGVMMLRTLGDP